jgi:hypothetical protein
MLGRANFAALKRLIKSFQKAKSVSRKPETKDEKSKPSATGAEQSIIKSSSPKTKLEPSPIFDDRGYHIVPEIEMVTMEQAKALNKRYENKRKMYRKLHPHLTKDQT